MRTGIRIKQDLYLVVVCGIVFFLVGWLSAGYKVQRAPSVARKLAPPVDVKGNLPLSTQAGRVWILEQAGGQRDVIVFDTKQEAPGGGEVTVNGRMAESFTIEGVMIRVFVDCVP